MPCQTFRFDSHGPLIVVTVGYGDRSEKLTALVDGGASHLGVSSVVARRLQLKPRGRMRVGTANGPLTTRFFRADLKLHFPKSDIAFPEAQFFEFQRINGVDVIIGRLIWKNGLMQMLMSEDSNVCTLCL